MLLKPDELDEIRRRYLEGTVLYADHARRLLDHIDGQSAEIVTLKAQVASLLKLGEPVWNAEEQKMWEKYDK